MKYILNIPSLLYILIFYNILAFSGVDFTTVLFSTSLISEAVLTVTWEELFILLGVVALYIETIKSTRTSSSAIFEHTLSMVVFVVYLVEFLMVAQVGTTSFLILGMMQLLDVIGGFTITISAARRDFGGGLHH